MTTHTQPSHIFIKFSQLTGAKMRILRQEIAVKGKQVDAEIEIKTGTQRTTFFVEQKNEIREAMLPILFKRMKPRSNWLLACQYIPATIKEILINAGVNYLEAAGNCYIRTDNMIFYINDKAVTSYRTAKEGKIWNVAGIKFLFAILQLPSILNLPYRRLALTAGISLGYIGPFLNELEENGFLKKSVVNKKRTYFIQNKEELLLKWAEHYSSILKPKLKKGKFRFLDKVEWNKRTKALPPETYWGGEAAGAELTGYLVPEKFTLYTNVPIPKVMKDMKLVPDENGDIEVLEVFWNMAIFNVVNQPTIPALIVYAELINSLDSRNRETAKRIKIAYLD